jgi:hypothetical protein
MKYYIFAANYQHALNCARQHDLNPKDITYVNHEERLFGILKNEGIEFIFYETFSQHPRYHEIEAQILLIESLSDSFMQSYMYNKKELKMGEPTDTFWWRLVHLNPTLIRGVVVSLVLLISSFGILISPEVPNSLIGFIAAILAMVQALWTRPAVTANARVAVYVPDPINAPGVVEAGNATTTATPKDIIDAARASGETNDS